MRKDVRRKQVPIEGSTDPADILQYQVYEAFQLAYKVTANSIYGALALRNSKLGASVTAEGRRMLRVVSESAENELSTWLQNEKWTEEDVNATIPDGDKDSGKTCPL